VKKIIKVGQGGYAIAKIGENVQLETYDIIECVGVLAIGKNECLLLHVDIYTDVEGICEVIKNYFNTDETLELRLILANNPTLVDSESSQAIDINYKNVIRAMNMLRENVFKINQKEIRLGNDANAGMNMAQFAYDFQAKKIKEPSDVGLMNKYNTSNETLLIKMQDRFYCRTALSMMYRATCGKEFSQLINFRNFELPIDSLTLQKMTSQISYLLIWRQEYYVKEKIWQLEDQQYEYMAVFYFIYSNFSDKFQQKIIEICKDEGKYIDKANLQQAAHELTTWIMKSDWSYKLPSLTKDESIQFDAIINSLNDLIPQWIVKNDIWDNSRQIFKFSNVFSLGCASHHIDIKRIREGLPNIASIDTNPVASPFLQARPQ